MATAEEILWYTWPCVIESIENKPSIGEYWMLAIINIWILWIWLILFYYIRYLSKGIIILQATLGTIISINTIKTINESFWSHPCEIIISSKGSCPLGWSICINHLEILTYITINSVLLFLIFLTVYKNKKAFSIQMLIWLLTIFCIWYRDYIF